jgi:dTDP-4-dehydrorhamnose reductase
VPRPTVLLTGAGGQVGFELARSLASLCEVIAPDRAALDLADADAIVSVVRQTRPQLIVNAAAYTAVDKAETESAAAFAINGRAPGILAEEAKQLGAVLIHYSTDYVFDGRRSTPYDEEAPTVLSTSYWREQARRRMRHRAIRRPRAGISHQLGLRHARKQFPADDTEARARTRRTAHRRGPVRDAELVPHAVRRNGSAVARGLPWLAERSGCITLPRREKRRGTASPRTIIGDAPRPRVVPIATSEYPTPARRPAYGVLSTRKFEAAFGYRLPDWREGLRRAVADAGAHLPARD